MTTKVFVGNLAFRTTDQALQEAFSKCGEVKSGVIITRGRRSLGYGFVEFQTAEQAIAAVEKMNKAELFGRQVKAELAKDPAERPATSEGSGEPGPAKRRKRAAPREANTTNDTTNAPSFPGNAATDTGAKEDGGDERAGRRKRTRKPKTEGNTGTAPSPATSPSKQKIPSKTTLFVANLPFSIDDAQLATVFEGTKMKSAHVVRTRTGRSRGYGFVEFETELDQNEALKNTNGKEVSGVNGTRNISVTISNSVASSTAIETAPTTTTTTTTTATPSKPEATPDETKKDEVPTTATSNS